MNKTYVMLFLFVLVVFLIGYKAYALNRNFRAEVADAFSTGASSGKSDGKSELLTESDIAHLPDPVRNYLIYTGVIGKEKVRNFRLVGEGEFKTGQDKPWVPARAEQYNFIENPRRIYFMKLNLSGLPVVGLHVYKNATAAMLIKIAGLITVGDAKGEIMNKAETVTVFNDMCLMAPATLIDPRIEWKQIDALTVQGVFNNNGIQVSAILTFNEQGELTNFVSNDRYMTSSGSTYQNAPWSTPVSQYKIFNGVKIASYGEAHWLLPDGDFCYGKIYLKEVQYNVSESSVN